MSFANIAIVTFNKLKYFLPILSVVVGCFFCDSMTPESLNKRASLPENKAEKILEVLSISKGDTIADIGSGGGYFSFRFAERVGRKGSVYAVDVNEKFLSHIKQNILQKNINNIRLIKAKQRESGLPEKCCELIFLRNVYHHLPSPIGYMQLLKKKLKKNGVIIIIENKEPRLFRFLSFWKNYTKSKKILQNMNQAGFQRINDYSFIKKQSFQVFKLR